MFSDPIGAVVREARGRVGLSQRDLARRCGVSTRLVSELENGQRPNASVEATLHLLSALGVSVQFSGPGGAFAEIPSQSAAMLQREARAAQRRANWSGGHVPMHACERMPSGARTPADRFVAVVEVSRQAYAIAAAAHGKTSRRGRKKRM